MTGRKPRVVIVGGGFAGRTARRLLKEDCDVVMIDGKGYFEYVPSILRCLVEPKEAKKIVLPQPTHTVVATARSVQGNQVILADGEGMEFDYCLLCTGSIYAPPIKGNLIEPCTVDDRVKDIQTEALRLAAARTVVIVGGGTVGVELAAEIAGKYGRHKSVVLITSKATLLDRMPKKAGRYAERWMERYGVEVVKNERVMDWTLPIKTDTGRSIDADMVYRCIGFQPASFPPHVAPFEVDDRTLRLKTASNVFACGDCTSTKEEKTAFAADLSAQLAAQNILRSIEGASLLVWPKDVCQGRDAVPEIMCVSLYKSDAILQINGWVMTGFVAATVKSQIESMQLALAKEATWAIGVWKLLELSNLWISKLF